MEVLACLGRQFLAVTFFEPVVTLATRARPRPPLRTKPLRTAPNHNHNHTKPQGKAAAAAAAAAGMPLTIGRPVAKSAKEAAKAAAPVAGVRQRATGTAGGMPIIGRPVVIATPTKVPKVPGLGDSPQASTQMQQQAGALGAGGRMGSSGPGTPGQTMQVSRALRFEWSMGRWYSRSEVCVWRWGCTVRAVLGRKVGPKRRGKDVYSYGWVLG